MDIYCHCENTQPHNCYIYDFTCILLRLLCYRIQKKSVHFLRFLKASCKGGKPYSKDGNSSFITSKPYFEGL